jgi:hypothetical protein
MEGRMKEVQEKFAAVQQALSAWMKEDMKIEARPATYSISLSLDRLKESFMWAQDAHVQEIHFAKLVEKTTETKPGLELMK